MARGCISARLGRDRNLAVVFQVELRQSTKFMERFSATLLREYLGLIRDAIADGQRAGLFRADIKPTAAAKMFFGALDEMATNWMLSRRRYSLEADAEPSSISSSTARGARCHAAPIRIGAVLGAGTMGAQIAAHFANAGVPVLLLDVTADVAREGLEARARRSSPIRSSPPDALALITTGGFDTDLPRLPDADWIIEAVVERLDVKRALLERVDAVRAPASIVSSNTSGHSDRARWPKDAATTSAGTGSARTSSIRRATCGCSR